MTAEEIVLGGYKNFAEGDMEALSKIYHPKCKITINGNHSLSGTYIGFQSFLEKVLAKGYRTPDLMMGDQGLLCSTREMTDKILEELDASL